MAYQYKLQIPISRDLNKKLKTRIAKIGLSSVSDLVRMLLISYVNGDLEISFTQNQDANVEFCKVKSKMRSS